jgi:low temperature requirement protein LtrA
LTSAIRKNLKEAQSVHELKLLYHGYMLREQRMLEVMVKRMKHLKEVLSIPEDDADFHELLLQVHERFQVTSTQVSDMLLGFEEDEEELQEAIALHEQQDADDANAAAAAAAAAANADPSSTNDIELQSRSKPAPLQRQTTSSKFGDISTARESHLLADTRQALHSAEAINKHFGMLTSSFEALEERPIDTAGVFKHPHLLRRPRLHQYWKFKPNGEKVLVREDRERHAAYHELFFDLIFVVVLSHLGHDLQANRDRNGIFEFIVLFVATWRIWITANVLQNWYDPSDAFHKLFYFCQMAGVLGIAIHTVDGVIGSYLFCRTITILMHVWCAYYEPRVRKTVVANFVTFALGAVLWVWSWFVDTSDFTGSRPNTTHLIMWACALSLEIVLQNAITLIKPRLRIPINIEHFAERISLYMIVCLGEQVVALLFLDELSTTDTYVVAVCGGLTIWSFFITYFDVQGGLQLVHALRVGKHYGVIWFNMHIFIQAAIVGSSAGLALLLQSTQTSLTAALTAPRNDVLPPFDLASSAATPDALDSSFSRWVYCGFEGSIWIMLAFLDSLHTSYHITTVPKKVRLSLRVIVGLGVISLGLFDEDQLSQTEMIAASTCAITALSLLELFGGVVPHHNVNLHADIQSNRPATPTAGITHLRRADRADRNRGTHHKVLNKRSSRRRMTPLGRLNVVMDDGGHAHVESHVLDAENPPKMTVVAEAETESWQDQEQITPRME